MKLLVILSIVSFIALARCACPDQFVDILGSCFYFQISAPAAYEDARAQCKDAAFLLGIPEEDADMAILSDCHLFQAVIQHIMKYNDTLAPPPGYSYWVAASDVAEEKTWYWNDGTILPYGPPFWGSVNGVALPRDDRVRNCAIMYRDDQYYLHDGDCTKRAYGLCQIASLAN